MLGGSGLGLIAWVLTGLGSAELKLIPGFDPFGMVADAPPKTAAVNILEWSFPAFALVGALVFPRLALWLVKPSDRSGP